MYVIFNLQDIESCKSLLICRCNNHNIRTGVTKQDVKLFRRINRHVPEIDGLTTPEKILMLEELWDDIASDTAHIAVPESHKQELDKRLENARQKNGTLLSLDEPMARVETRK